MEGCHFLWGTKGFLGDTTFREGGAYFGIQKTFLRDTITFFRFKKNFLGDTEAFFGRQKTFLR